MFRLRPLQGERDPHRGQSSSSPSLISVIGYRTPVICYRVSDTVSVIEHLLCVIGYRIIGCRFFVYLLGYWLSVWWLLAIGFRLSGMGYRISWLAVCWLSVIGFHFSHNRLGDTGYRLWKYCCRVSVIQYRLSVIPLSALGCRILVVGYRGFAVDYRISIGGYWPSIVGKLLWIIDYRTLVLYRSLGYSSVIITSIIIFCCWRRHYRPFLSFLFLS